MRSSSKLVGIMNLCSKHRWPILPNLNTGDLPSHSTDIPVLHLPGTHLARLIRVTLRPGLKNRRQHRLPLHMRPTLAASRPFLTVPPLIHPIPVTRPRLECPLCSNIPRNPTLTKLCTTAPSLHLTTLKNWEHLSMIHPLTTLLLLSVCPTPQLVKPRLLARLNSSNSKTTRLQHTPPKIHLRLHPRLSCPRSRINSSNSNSSNTKPRTPTPLMPHNPHLHTSPHQCLPQPSPSIHPTHPQRVSIKHTSHREEQLAQIQLLSIGKRLALFI
jgi:hypothetical protein